MTSLRSTNDGRSHSVFLLKALFEKVTLDEQRSILVRQFRLPYFDAPWHYHPEFELTYIVSGYGHRFVGDHVEPFGPGDLVLVGPDLPHFWRSDDAFYQGQPGPQAESVVVQFPGTPLRDTLLSAPEARPVRELLERARYGLRFDPAASRAVAAPMRALVDRTGFAQVLDLLAILDQLCTDPNAALLASDGYQLAPSQAETERMKRVLEYVLAHFREEIRIEQIASVAGMAPAAFCRYFRKKTTKSFVEYVTELRIGNARKLLANNDLSVGQVGLECGFNNSSHFHRQFKLHTGVTPFRYQTLSRTK